MYKISFHKRVRRFQIVLDKLHLGYFSSYSDAVIARNLFFHEKHGQAGLLIEWMLRKHRSKSRTVIKELQRRKALKKRIR